MLLAIDVGNTNTVLGVFDASRLRDSFRVQTEKDRTGDEYGLQIKALFDFAGLKMADVHDVIVSSVVPPMAFMTPICETCCATMALIVLITKNRPSVSDKIAMTPIIMLTPLTMSCCGCFVGGVT